MTKHYDWAAEMIKIASAPEMQKLAFSRDGIEFSETPKHSVETELLRSAQEAPVEVQQSPEVQAVVEAISEPQDDVVEVQASLEDTAALMLEISDELEDSGHERLAAATIALADVMLKTAAKRKAPAFQKGTGPHSSAESKHETKASPYSSSPSSRKKHDTDKSTKTKGKKLTVKERMAKMRAGKKTKK